MTRIRSFVVMLPVMIMPATVLCLTGIEHWLATFGTTMKARMALGQFGIALPYVAAAMTGLVILFAIRGSPTIKSVGWGVAVGGGVVVAVAVLREARRLFSFAAHVSGAGSVLAFIDPATVTGAGAAVMAASFGLRVALKGNAAFSNPRPRQLRGRRAIHGEADWMKLHAARSLFPASGGIVVGEAGRVDLSDLAERPFRADDPDTWGEGGTAPLLCFNASFGSTHGISFAGSGGYKTSSVTIPTALKWNGTLIVLDPSNEVAPLVARQRKKAGRDIILIDPKQADVGFNALDWIGKHGGSREEDIAAVASWIMSDSGRATGVRDDFFRSSGLQLLTAMIADVCLSGQTLEHNQTLRQVRLNLSEPEPKLRERLKHIHEHSQSDFVKENVAAFVNMTPETFSGVYANAIKETHWLSYPNYAGLVSGSTFSTSAIAEGDTDVFINIDLKTLETHAGLARVVVGALLNAMYNRKRVGRDRALFLLDEVARLGYMRILETARDAGRKYGITLTLLFQSIGQMREAYGGRDAASKWFESASWVSFAAINDPETAEYISRRCGTMTVEVDQLTRSFGAKGTSRTRAKQIAARPLIQAHEVLGMRADEQIVFTSGNPPLRCGRAIWFRRPDMLGCVGNGPSRSGTTRRP